MWIQHLPFSLGHDEPCWCLQIPYTHSHESPWRLFSPQGELSGWGLYPGPRLTLCALAIRDTTSQQGPYERNTHSFFWPCTLLSDGDGQLPCHNITCVLVLPLFLSHKLTFIHLVRHLEIEKGSRSFLISCVATHSVKRHELLFPSEQTLLFPA